MPDSNEDKLVVALVACSRCGNAFMIKKGQKKTDDLVCDNCIRLEERKKQLSDSVKESQKEIESSIKAYKNSLRVAKSQQIKQIYFDKIKKTSKTLNNSVDLLKKIEKTNDERYIEEYKKLFEEMKRDYVDK
jgi:ssDNA-binding Zn-finger/Zn-ribbon topoisomerase 1